MRPDTLSSGESNFDWVSVVLKYGLTTGSDMPDAVDRAMRARPSWPGHARTKSPGAVPDRHARGPTACLTATR
jgi:hypothetical protein